MADEIDALLPQTQCTKCGYAGCRPYAEAIERGEAGINQCPPGGEAGIHALATLLGVALQPLDPTHGAEQPRSAAFIREELCIGCTLCIQACPVDAIVGAPKRMHTVLIEACTGCELCVPPCPVDCIDMLALTELASRGSAQAAGEATVAVAAHADRWRQRYSFHQVRTRRERQERDARLAAKLAEKLDAMDASGPDEDLQRKRAVITAALERARARRSVAGGHGPGT
jgi:electron transport complex protein RnfB